MSTILDCSRCGKEYKYSEIDEHECADVVVLRARIALLEKVAEAAKRMAERPSDVAKLIDLRAALKGGKG